MRRLRLAAVVPDEIHAGGATALGVRVANRKRWLPSYSVTLQAGECRLYLDRLRAGEERLLTWEATFARAWPAATARPARGHAVPVRAVREDGASDSR